MIAYYRKFKHFSNVMYVMHSLSFLPEELKSVIFTIQAKHYIHQFWVT